MIPGIGQRKMLLSGGAGGFNGGAGLGAEVMGMLWTGSGVGFIRDAILGIYKSRGVW
jgi:hypothetical protein